VPTCGSDLLGRTRRRRWRSPCSSHLGCARIGHCHGSHIGPLRCTPRGRLRLAMGRNQARAC
jgi:hypothetical protein